MSTDLQKYSTENQLHTIRRYAEQRGFTIVRVFEDSGRSGLRMDGRDGLQSLMLEVQSGAAGFQAILVYDVSRWGRFQDADEGAYHEHVCSRAGIRVHYCGEQFDNDGSIGSILLKNVKRVIQPISGHEVRRHPRYISHVAVLLLRRARPSLLPMGRSTKDLRASRPGRRDD